MIVKTQMPTVGCWNAHCWILKCQLRISNAHCSIRSTMLSYSAVWFDLSLNRHSNCLLGAVSMSLIVCDPGRGMWATHRRVRFQLCAVGSGNKDCGCVVNTTIICGACIEPINRQVFLRFSFPGRCQLARACRVPRVATPPSWSRTQRLASPPSGMHSAANASPVKSAFRLFRF